jgi:hypothetical protein
MEDPQNDDLVGLDAEDDRGPVAIADLAQPRLHIGTRSSALWECFERIAVIDNMANVLRCCSLSGFRQNIIIYFRQIRFRGRVKYDGIAHYEAVFSSLRALM